MLAQGTILQNRYEVVRLLGQGGFGAVYQARAVHLGKFVALKENLGGDVRQFQQEAVLLANLAHPNLPRVIDHFVEANGAQYLVMDFIEGEDLETRWEREGALPEARVLAWFDQILDAVAYLHARGVIHRDIKPGNIKITPSGQAVLVDFGIAKVFQPGQATVTGAKAGSPGFAAPEQYRGGTDQRTDIYALGATLYTILTNAAPPDAKALDLRAASLTPPRTLNPALSAHTEEVILRAMELPPGQRFQKADEMRRALSGSRILRTAAVQVPATSAPVTTTVPISSVRPRIPVLLIGVLAVIGLLILFGLGGLALSITGVSTVPTSTQVVAFVPSETTTATHAPATNTMIPPTATALPPSPTVSPPPPPPPPPSGCIRVTFAPGATEADVQGNLQPGQSQEYCINALQGQTMMLTLKGAVGGGSVRGKQAMPSQTFQQRSSDWYWQGVLPSTQDYVITVMGGKAALDFSLKVVIPPPQPPPCGPTTQRIRFPPGGTFAHMEGGAVSPGCSKSFVLGIGAGQTLGLAYAGYNVFTGNVTVRDPLGNILSGAGAAGTAYYSAATTGDYTITFDGTGQATFDVSVPP